MSVQTIVIKYSENNNIIWTILNEKYYIIKDIPESKKIKNISIFIVSIIFHQEIIYKTT